MVYQFIHLYWLVVMVQNVEHIEMQIAKQTKWKAVPKNDSNLK